MLEEKLEAVEGGEVCVTYATGMASLGQIRTLVEYPASMTHAAVPAAIQEQVHIDPGGIRLSIGLEYPHDIIADLSAALDVI
jgi:cystathionine beta-lyase/cystathionine gamma-synthase